MPAVRRAWDRAAQWAIGPVDAVRLDAFRRVFALTFLCYMAFRFLDWREWLTSFGYHHDAATASCSRGEPFPLLPPWAVPAFGVATLGSSALLVLGRWVRPMAIVATACAVYAQRVDEISSYSLNKIYIVLFTILACAPSPAPLDPDVPRSRRVVSAWPVRIVQVSLAIQYFTAGACKVLHGAWMKVDDVLYSQIIGTFRTDIAAALVRVLPRPVFGMLELATLAFELLAPLTFAWKRTRPYALIAGVVFHSFIALTMYSLFYFSAQIVAYYVLFLDPKTLRRLRHRAGAAWLRLTRRGTSRGSATGS